MPDAVGQLQEWTVPDGPPLPRAVSLLIYALTSTLTAAWAGLLLWLTAQAAIQLGNAVPLPRQNPAAELRCLDFGCGVAVAPADQKTERVALS
jgi:hypothetical protein